ncbi:right-handed parallel beta-helix repeat-containing protein [Parvularcula sp. LCG005]|uniref:right-handed parallel beta-helix repeat-containing protein n=1 Tax=Parvularcula sp. LCG005 TaxID=3078805 RepID=UPI002943AC85|nr:right-handed parallel beta-helix repeat-containing protein [Parvularcula sp. LCG005]WOI53633.1 hypothetical protein RUI03_01235 [Parvularcula sp. LCG005]
MIRWGAIVGAIILAVVLPIDAAAEQLTVGPDRQYRDLDAAVRASRAGDELVLQPGRYVAADLKIPHDLTLTGTGDVVLYAPAPVAKGLLVPGAGTEIVVRNLTFEGARSPDRNGAGIRFEGSSLRVEDSTFRRNEDGILATGDPGGMLVIHRSRFEANGHGDGYSHAIYQSRGQRFEVHDSDFVGTRIGHHVKSLAALIVVDNNRFDDGDGEPSYVVDATAGGRLIITNNQVIRRASASQDTLFNYDVSRGGRVGAVTISDNVLTTAKRGTELLRNPERAPVTSTDNRFQTAARGSFDDIRNAETVAEPAMPAASPRAVVPAIQSTSDVDSRLENLTPQQRRAVAKLVAQTPPVERDLTHPKVSADGLLHSPQFPPKADGDLVRFKLRPVIAGESPYVIFGQVFEPGMVKPDTGLVARIGGTEVPVQIVPKALHPDGSVRHAVLSLRVPDGTTAIVDAALRLGPAPSGPAAGLDSLPNLMLTVEGNLGGRTPTTIKRSLRGFLDHSTVWVNGPVVTERTGRSELGPLLSVTADMRLYADRTGRVRLTFENYKTFHDAPRDLSYRVTVTDGDEVLFADTINLHYRNAGWTTVLPIRARRAFDVVHDLESLIAAGAMPGYDLALGIAPDSLPSTNEPVRPGVAGPLTPYMPTTGGRTDIGPQTGWAAAWTITQDPAAKRLLLYTADIGITVPWHFRDDATGLPVITTNRPRFWAEERGAEAKYGKDRVPASLFAGQSGGWTPDVAHKPSLAYPAYLATGEAVYARELAHEAAFAITNIWPDLRGPSGDLLTGALQLRTTAWSLRSVGDAAFILPEDHPLKDYFRTVLAHNIDDLVGNYVRRGTMDSAGETEGYFGIASAREDEAISPWQNDYMAIVLAQEVRRGTPGARALLNWSAGYVAGRVLAPGSNIDVIAGQRQRVIGPTGARYQSWRDIFTETARLHPDDVYLGGAEGGYGLLRGALGAIVQATNDPRATVALARLKALEGGDKLTEPSNQLGRSYSPQFALDPAD